MVSIKQIVQPLWHFVRRTMDISDDVVVVVVFKLQKNHDRDLNAAINIHQEALRIVV